MDASLPEFSESQLQFLSVLNAFDGPVSIEVAGALAPLTPGPMFDLLRKGTEQGWIRNFQNERFELTETFPPSARESLERVSGQSLPALIDRMTKLHLLDRVEPEALARLFARAGRSDLAGLMEIKLALQEMKKESLDHAWDHILRAREQIPAILQARQADPGYVSDALELSQLCFVRGQAIKELEDFLSAARDLARRLGDQRQWALTNLHLGRLFYFTDRRLEAAKAFESGKKKVEELEDADILDQSVEFLGIYDYMRGLFRQASEHFTRALQINELYDRKMNHPLSPILLSYCEAYLGRYHWAVGGLDCYWHEAKRKQNHYLAATAQAALGTILLIIGKKREGLHHLESAELEAEQQGNAFARHFALGGQSYYHFLEGDLKRAYELLQQASFLSQESGFSRQYSSPWILEMLFELGRNGMMIDEIKLQNHLREIISGPNIHLKGVALRLDATLERIQGGDSGRIVSGLLESEKCLVQTGDVIQLAKTRIDLALLRLNEGKVDEARYLAQRARQGLSGQWEESFPDGLRSLLEERSCSDHHAQMSQAMLRRFLEISDELIPTIGRAEIMGQVVAVMNRFFMAERGGLFWLKKRDGRPILRAARNLLPEEVEAESFRQNLELIVRAYRKNQPIVVGPGEVRTQGGSRRIQAILCLPVEVEGGVRGVLYFDNSYLDNCFDFAKGPLLSDLARHLTGYVRRAWEYGLKLDQIQQLAFVHPSKEDAETKDVMYRSRIMGRILAQADRAANSGASVMILGETGVGKEVLARWIHQHSPRNNGPFVVVDPTTIPENLVESELFGHEKGAFTGADRQKPGRIELADGGTLFIDEIGEIPHPLQTKFLRVLQEKTFVRIGGTRSIRSDFRLLTATNRDLAREVETGRFRRDLYYRIGVLELRIPPLRERPEDVILFAGRFLSVFTRKHGRPGLVLTPEDEKRLTDYAWPGNVRELENVIERAVLLSPGEKLDLNLPSAPSPPKNNPFEDLPSMEELQRRYIWYVLEKTGGRVSGPGGAAELLHMKRTTLHSRMGKLGMSR